MGGCVLNVIECIDWILHRLNDLLYPIEHGCTVEIAEILSGILLDLCLDAASRAVIGEHPKLGMRNTLNRTHSCFHDRGRSREGV